MAGPGGRLSQRVSPPRPTILGVSVRTHWVDYGRPAAEALRQAISEAKAGEPLSPVSVVVPSNHVGVATRRLLASGLLGPVSAPGHRSGGRDLPHRLPARGAARCPRLAAEGRRPVSTPVIARRPAVRPGRRARDLRPGRRPPGHRDRAIAAYRELRDLSPDALDALATQSRRAADVVRLQRAARQQLEPAWYDEEDLLDAAVAALVDGPVHRRARERLRLPAPAHLPSRRPSAGGGGGAPAARRHRRHDRGGGGRRRGRPVRAAARRTIRAPAARRRPTGRRRVGRRRHPDRHRLRCR